MTIDFNQLPSSLKKKISIDLYKGETEKKLYKVYYKNSEISSEFIWDINRNNIRKEKKDKKISYIKQLTINFKEDYKMLLLEDIKINISVENPKSWYTQIKQ